MSDNRYVYESYSEEYWTDLSDFIAQFQESEIIFDDFLINVANDTFELAKEYCPVKTGRLRDSLKLIVSKDGFIINSDCPYAGYVHEILSYYHEPPTRAGFLIEAFKSVMLNYMSILHDDTPFFKIDMRVIPLSLTFYNNTDYGSVKTPELFSNTVTGKFRGTKNKFFTDNKKIQDLYKDVKYNNNETLGFPWTLYFGSGVKTKIYPTLGTHTDLISTLEQHNEPLTPDLINSAVSKMFNNYRGKSFNISGTAKLVDFDEVNR